MDLCQHYELPWAEVVFEASSVVILVCLPLLVLKFLKFRFRSYYCWETCYVLQWFLRRYNREKGWFKTLPLWIWVINKRIFLVYLFWNTFQNKCLTFLLWPSEILESSLQVSSMIIGYVYWVLIKRHILLSQSPMALSSIMQVFLQP